MKALTLTQPWATLVALGAKKVETRSWNTRYRGPLAIHAAQRMTRESIALVTEGLFWMALKDYLAAHDLPRGAIVATTELMDVISTDLYQPESEQERAFGDYSPGRFAWLLGEVHPFTVPAPTKGALGLWYWSRP